MVLPFEAPDLLNGYMVNNFEGENRWQTYVECALRKTDSDGRVAWSYLSSECRAEDIYSLHNRIFFPNNYEFCLAQTWSGTYAIRNGSYLYGLNPTKNRRARKRGWHGEQPGRLELFTYPSQVFCPQIEVRPLEFDQALSFLQSAEIKKDNHLYMRIDWLAPDGSGNRYSLFIPARYLNFPNPESEKAAYIQPQSGYALYPEDDGGFCLGYISVDLVPDGTRRLEFGLRKPVSFLSTKKRRSWLYRPLSILDAILAKDVLLTDEFNHIVTLEGHCVLYRYLSHPGA